MKKFFLLCCAVILCGCAKNYHLDLASMQPMPQDQEAADIPRNCEYLYENKKWEVAVVEFINNTGYGDMSLTTGSHTTSGTTNTVGVGAKTGKINRKGNYAEVGVDFEKAFSNFKGSSAEFMGEFAPSLGTFAQSVTEEALAQLGGVSLINRSHLDKILQEQQFQMTLADPDTVMEFGLLSGAKYIFTGSVDNIQANYVAPTGLRSNNTEIGAIISVISAGYDSAASGWFVTAAFTLNLLDAETGKLLYSRAFNGKKRATQSENFQADIVINTAKLIISEAVKTARNDLVNVFEVSGYINEIRGGKKIAQINLGADSGIHEGDILDVYDVHIATDFMTKRQKCSLIKLDAKVIVSDQISSGGSWGFIEGKRDSVKIGSYVKRSAVKE